MTVIAYRDGTMACDSLTTLSNDVVSWNAEKVIRLASGALLGACGCGCDNREFRSLFDTVSTPSDIPRLDALSDLKIDCTILLVLPDSSVWFIVIDKESNGNWSSSVARAHEYMSVGSGSDVAQGALEMGATAKEAVEVAIKWNVKCGGPVQEFRLHEDSSH